MWPDLYATSRGRVVSDHFPIMVQNRLVDFGPKPFRVFNSWLQHEKIKDIISGAWSIVIREKPDFILKQNIKLLKNALKSSCKSSTAGIEEKVWSLRKVKRKVGLRC